MKNSFLALFSIAAFGLTCNQVRAGSEWGYESEPEKPVGLSAGPAKSLGGHSAESPNKLPKAQASNKEALTQAKQNTAAKTEHPQSGGLSAARRSQSRLQARALPPCAIPGDRNEQALHYWIKLFEFAGSQPLTAEQKEQINQRLKSKLSSPQAADVTGILQFWPRVESAAAASPEQKDNYKGLLRALLRLSERKSEQSDPDYAGLIGEVLGPTRVAAPGTPPLTEDAIEAYADMACFLYEQGHPGKTVNADDNRMVFAGVIRNKFMEAPSEKDKNAMANFDLTWSRFKILWTGADEQGRQKLLAAWGHKSTAGGAERKDPTLEAVLNNGPWSHAN
jgi:hypothetical protein